MKKYKLINRKTQEEHTCTKTGNYYVSSEVITPKDKILCDERNHISDPPQFAVRTCKSIDNGWVMTDEVPGQGENPEWTKKIIATNNPDIDIPKVIDESEGSKLIELINNTLPHEQLTMNQESIIYHHKKHIKTNPNSDQDTMEFAEFVDDLGYTKVDNTIWKSINDEKGKTTKELFDMWSAQRVETVYFE